MSGVTPHSVDGGVHGLPILEPSPRDGDSAERRERIMNITTRAAPGMTSSSSILSPRWTMWTTMMLPRSPTM
nr:MAG TPA: hypothetical protein [Caudoviricetes sp.]